MLQRSLKTVIGVLLSLSLIFSASRADDNAKLVSIIQIVEHPALDATRQGILDELKNQPLKIDFQSAQGNTTLAAQIAQKFVGSSPSVMVGIGTTASQALLSASQHKPIPIVFSSVTDPLGAKLVSDLNHPKGKVTGVSNFIDPALPFEFFKKIIPNLTKIGIIYNPGEANSVSLVEKMKRAALNHGLELFLATANTSADCSQATQTLMNKVQAIFINNDNTALSAFDSIIKISTENKIPVFCSDMDMIKQGALAAFGPNQYEIGRQTGRIILKILNDKEKPNEIPIVFPDKIEQSINQIQAKKLGLKIHSAEVKTE